MLETLNPDVITMDVEMPGMDGLSATRIIMERFPRPIIMLSSMTEQGTETTLKALAAGAVDFISKKSSFVQLDIVKIGKELHEKIRYWGERRLLKSSVNRTPQSNWPVKGLPDCSGGFNPELILIGVSTGGPAILPNLLHVMGHLTCPVVIAQHMPLLFTEGFARHLKLSSGLNVLQASDGMALIPGMVVVCPGGSDTTLREPLPGRLLSCIKHDAATQVHPSIDKLFLSAVRLDRKVVAIVMTGMGSDGTIGARALAARGCQVLAQEPGECTVDGMPTSAIDSGVVNEVLNVENLGRRLRTWAGTA